MNTTDRATGPNVDRLVDRALADLASRAPVGLATNVLVETGLADHYGWVSSPLGPLVVAWNGIGVSLVDVDSGGTDFETRHLRLTGRAAHRASDGVPTALADAIARRLAGDRRVRIDLDLRGTTDFERDVWAKTLEIPRGEVRPYGWIAAEIGRPKAVRAVGTALGHNPVPLIVPCHRVVRTDGTIGQYSLGGPENKRTILRAEGLDPEAMEREAAVGIRYVGSDTTRIVCVPTCHHARRIGDTHRVPFRSLVAATGSGYRPCRVCRPASGASAGAAA